MKRLLVLSLVTISSYFHAETADVFQKTVAREEFINNALVGAGNTFRQRIVAKGNFYNLSQADKEWKYVKQIDSELFPKGFFPFAPGKTVYRTYKELASIPFPAFINQIPPQRQLEYKPGIEKERGLIVFIAVKLLLTPPELQIIKYEITARLLTQDEYEESKYRQQSATGI